MGNDGGRLDGDVVGSGTQPVGGASALFPAGPAATMQGGQASVDVQANVIFGTYTVVAANGGGWRISSRCGSRVLGFD
jgi:hypothetical protein